MKTIVFDAAYSYRTDEQFQAFQASIRDHLPQWLPA